jgi:precorrin-8X/cobalt-precorrin-8 methylmutase
MQGNLLRRYGLGADQIEAESLARLEALAGADLPSDPAARLVASRMVYAAGDPELARCVVVQPTAIQAGVAALRNGAPIIVDVGMVAAGIRRDKVERLGCTLSVAVEQAGTHSSGMTRAAAGVQSLAGKLDGSVVAIGNAPTALLALLDLVDSGVRPPALVIGVPVGLVAAAESKLELSRRDVPYVTVLGTRGGSPLAAAATNALLDLATDVR